ncbi:MAG: response regulator [Candidatus Pristimantibacillus lignocellulolyticus]|uniref:Response regulator n=1 Tax=Candidatus Pristimantibacillus lignocellulolyticus TaxID=2994561 RepID=A0A9J6ZIC2_9BACL|nr:MAG: response regulator [Candidatus Pristimantibacillus lignocellulolyticus]
MLNVLIVDDEKIVRKGLVTFIPWKQFGMNVVGEANNGENALKFLEKNKVDLLFTDLSMPVMSGVELMREVNKKYPHIQMVVLTLHQDFDYIQEALRLGAIDYIAKTELEKEQFEDLLGRIVSLIDTKKLKNQNQTQMEYSVVDQVFVAYPLTQHNGECNDETPSLQGAIEVETDVWYWTYQPEQISMSGSHYAYFCIRDLKELDRKAVLKLIRSYRRNGLFYDYDPSETLQYVSEHTIRTSSSNDEYDLQEMKQKWLLSDWIYDNYLFEEMIGEIKRLRLPSIRLTRLFFSLTDEWNRLYGTLLESSIIMKDSFSHYYEFVAWLTQTRTRIHESNVKPQFSIEIQSSIAKAKTMAQHTFNKPLTAGEMAKSVSMSLSYFSQCFKQIVGQTYTDYLRDIRMERAKSYLLNTTKTIQWIAEEVGYNDEKYFSRLFKEHIGMLPSEYRLVITQEKLK